MRNNDDTSSSGPTASNYRTSTRRAKASFRRAMQRLAAARLALWLPELRRRRTVFSSGEQSATVSSLRTAKQHLDAFSSTMLLSSSSKIVLRFNYFLPKS